jgi:DNA modification methylase
MRIVGDCREVLRDLPRGSVQMVCTSPPYWQLRSYGIGRKNGEIGLEPTIEEYVGTMVEVFRLVRDVLSEDGTLFLNLGDSYASGPTGTHRTQRDPRAMQNNSGWTKREQGTGNTLVSGLKPKDLCGIPWRVAFALQADGWWLRSDIIWHKSNPMPESVTDRPTKSHEYLFLLTKGPRYFYDAEAVREPNAVNPNWNYGSEKYARAITQDVYKVDGDNRTRKPYPKGWTSLAPAGPEGSGRNRRTVWTIPTEAFPGAHFATMPRKLVEPCILAGTSEVGHCPQCNARHVRVVERSGGTIGKSWHAHGDDSGKGMSQAGRLNSDTYKVETLGFRPTCTHNRKPVPDVCLDPFAGSGTTGMVAEQLGREFLGIEINGKYSKLAREAA